MNLLAALALLSLAAREPPPPPEGRWTTVVSALVKVRPHDALPSVHHGSLRAARGECAALQVVALPPLARVDVEASPLRSAGGSVTVDLFREDFIRVQTPSSSQGMTGLWPDPLLPLADASGRRYPRVLPAPSTLERPLVLYVEACVPLDARPGSYAGELTLSAEGHAPERVPLHLEVEPFALPATSTLLNTFGISLYTLAHGHRLAPDSPAAQALLHDYAAEMLKHRVSAHGMALEPPPATFRDGKAVLDFRAYDAELGPFLGGTALPSGARFTTADVRDNTKLKTDEERVLYYRAFRQHFLERGWPQQLFFYAKDEPKREDRPLVMAQAKRVHQAGGIPVLVTSALDPKLQPATDIYCPVLNCFFPRPGPETCTNVQTVEALRKRLPASAHIWWYQSCMSHGCSGGPMDDPKFERVFRDWASYMVDLPTALNQAMGPLAYLAGVEGELYFDVTAAYNDKDPWQDVFAFGGNGDGTLFYPGTPDRLGGTRHAPVPSLRLKSIRAGLQDFEYLHALDASGERAFAQRMVRQLVRSGYDITLEPAVWERTREEMAAHLRAHVPTLPPPPVSP